MFSSFLSFFKSLNDNTDSAISNQKVVVNSVKEVLKFSLPYLGSKGAVKFLKIFFFNISDEQNRPASEHVERHRRSASESSRERTRSGPECPSQRPTRQSLAKSIPRYA